MISDNSGLCSSRDQAYLPKAMSMPPTKAPRTPWSTKIIFSWCAQKSVPPCTQRSSHTHSTETASLSPRRVLESHFFGARMKRIRKSWCAAKIFFCARTTHHGEISSGARRRCFTKTLFWWAQDKYQIDTLVRVRAIFVPGDKLKTNTQIEDTHSACIERRMRNRMIFFWSAHSTVMRYKHCWLLCENTS